MNPVWIINFSQTFILDLEIVYFDYSNKSYKSKGLKNCS